MLFADRAYDPELVVCARPGARARRGGGRARSASRAAPPTGAASSTTRRSTSSSIAAPNMLHVELVEAAAQAGKHVFCEKPVGGTPEQTVRAERAVRAGGRDRRRRLQLPLGAARALRRRADRGRRARRADELPRALLLDVRRRPARRAVVALPARRGRPRRHVGPARRTRRPRALPRRADHARRRHDRDVHRRAPARRRLALRPRPRRGPARARSPTRTTPAMLCEFAERRARHVRGEPRDRRARRARWRSTSTAPRARPAGTSRRSTSCALYRATDDRGSGYTTVLGGERFPPHGAFVPGSANGIGFEDLVTIEDAEFCAAVAEGRPFSPGFDEALAVGLGPGGAAALGASRAAGRTSCRCGRT